MKSSLWLAATALLVAPAPGRTAPLPRATPKNVLLLIGDDHGLQLGCYGDKFIRTPNLDKLAAHGTRFTYAFAAVSSCSPSRSVIYTSQFNHTNGMYGLQHADHKQTSYANVASLPKLLNAAGYATAIMGKNHVGPKEAYPWGAELPGGRGDIRMAHTAKRFLNQAGDKPFCLVVGYTDPHRAGRGFDNEKRFEGIEAHKYDPATVPVPPFLPDTPAVRADIADYYESIDRMDQSIGQVLKVLDETGKRESTLVIYLSDNGMPFPGAKTTVYDSGIKLPLIVHAPGRKPTVSNAMASWVDILPTILEWTGQPASPKAFGRSLLPVLETEKPEGWDKVYASHQFHEITMYYPMRAVRTPKYKLIRNLAHPLTFPHASDLWGSPTWQDISASGLKRMGLRSTEKFLHRPEWELYDIDADPHETKDLADRPELGDLKRKLQADLAAWMKATGDPWVVVDRKP